MRLPVASPLGPTLPLGLSAVVCVGREVQSAAIVFERSRSGSTVVSTSTAKEKLIDWIYENATMRAEIYWDYQLVENYVYPRALKGMEPHATHLKAADDDMIKMYIKDKIHVVVVGGETNGYWRMMGCNYGGSVSVDEWR